MFVIKLLGIKRMFSKDPINYKKIRKRDIHHPNLNFLKNNLVRTFNVLETKITEVTHSKDPKELLIFIPGGAFISGPVRHHWDAIRDIAAMTTTTIWMCDYPKAPESKISKISSNIDLVYKRALVAYPSENISIIGDSAGGTLIIALVQRLIQKSVELPLRIILISPLMDATISNLQIDEIDKTDVMLSKRGVYSAMKMCAEDNDLSNPLISPINGSFKEFPYTILFLAENDITYPDQQLVVQKLIKEDVKIEVITGKNMPHIWPLLRFFKEAEITFNTQIIDRMKC